MKCKRCGTEVDTSARRTDGSVVCPGCGTVYKVNSAKKSTKPPTASGVQQAETRLSGGVLRNPNLFNAGWIIAAVTLFIMLLIGISVAMKLSQRNDHRSASDTENTFMTPPVRDDQGSVPTMESASGALATTIHDDAAPTSVPAPTLSAPINGILGKKPILGLIYTDEAEPQEEYIKDLCQQLGIDYRGFESYQTKNIYFLFAVEDIASELIEQGCTTLIIHDGDGINSIFPPEYIYDSVDSLSEMHPGVSVIFANNPNYIPFVRTGLTDHVIDLGNISANIKLADQLVHSPGSKSTRDTVYLSDLWHMTKLVLSECGPINLAPLCDLPCLESLELISDGIEDISPLGKMTQLKRLVLYDNNIKDINALSKLSNLEELQLQYNQVSNISPLSGLMGIKRLALNNNRITDISPLRGHNLLIWLSVKDNLIEDYSPIKDLLLDYLDVSMIEGQ